MPIRQDLPLAVPDHFGLHGAGVDANQVLFESAFEQSAMGNVAEMFGDEPDALFGGHPAPSVEPCQVELAGNSGGACVRPAG